MKFKTITYRRGVTLNIGDFESVRVDVEATVELDGEDFEEAYSAVKEEVDGAVRAEARAIRAKTK